MPQSKTRKVIVSVAPVGENASSAVDNPLTPEAVADSVTACAAAGAGMVHLHVRDQAGKQCADIGAFSLTLELIRKSSDIIIQGSTGGLSNLTAEERCTALLDERVEMASLNMGSVNFGDAVYINSVPDIRYWAQRMHEAQVMPELEIFDSGMIPLVGRMTKENVLQPPYGINICLGMPWALPADADHLLFIRNRLAKGVPWCVTHARMNDFSLLAAAIGMGAAAVRVGFEDSVYFAPQKPAQTNRELVERISALIRLMGAEVATPAEARRILGLF